ncbi:Transposable element Tcb1 transposase [Oopsacas minuta]|uniref:Transposable element Tcb1 transposase n=1 Tax=Oopsacas minuta TaxID=111878 RepID=A0AAV7K5U1_9METZ|nr:Transposable element Tcb1 transposase [Oopsacas minuta]
MVKEATLAVRTRAVCMIEAGIFINKVAKVVGVSVRTIRRWLLRSKSGEPLQNMRGRGRKTSVTMVPKVVIAKTIGKKMKSTRVISQNLKSKGFSISHVTVHSYLRKNLKVRPYKPQVQPKLTEKQRTARIKFCNERKNWSIDSWRRVLFSDESSFEVFHTPNKQNDRVWAKSSSNVPPTEKVKFPGKIMVWGVMSYRALSHLHIIPKGQTVTSEYYVEVILKQSLIPSMLRTRDSGTILERKLLLERSKAIFQQDGAPAHTSKRSQEWLKNNMPGFWTKDIWPPNSPDLNPIENLWAILQTKLDSMERATNLKMLEKQLILAWKEISPETLEKLIAGMPSRINKCLKLNGDYIGK